MNNKGNQKHLTFEQRVYIEKDLTENKSFAEIGRIIGKLPIYFICQAANYPSRRL